MDNEKLIEIVRKYKLLYDFNDKKYSDNQNKDEAWKEIGIKLKRNGKECKRTWALLRDAFRRAVKKRKEAKSGQVGVPEKKWKFEEEMSFLLPYMKKRQTNTFPTTDFAHYDTVNEVVEEAPVAEEAVQSPSTVLMKYIVESNKNAPPDDDIGQFFAGITTTVRSFPVRDRAIVKAKIFEVVSNMEIDILSRPSISSASASSYYSDYSPRQNPFDTAQTFTQETDDDVDEITPTTGSADLSYKKEHTEY